MLNGRAVLTEGIGFGAHSVALFGWFTEQRVQPVVVPELTELLDRWPVTGLALQLRSPLIAYNAELGEPQVYTWPVFADERVAAPQVLSMVVQHDGQLRVEPSRSTASTPTPRLLGGRHPSSQVVAVAIRSSATAPGPRIVSAKKS
jgi:hypothetical protein